jgi:hypothetical protein
MLLRSMVLLVLRLRLMLRLRLRRSLVLVRRLRCSLVLGPSRLRRLLVLRRRSLMRRLRWMFLVRWLLVLLTGRRRRMRFFLLVLPCRERGNCEPHHQQHRAGD